MKSILSKIGKTISILESEGFFHGGRRFLRVFWQYLKMMRPVGDGDILFVAGGAGGDSAIYRVHNQAEELSLHNFKCQTVTQDNFWMLSYPEKFKIFIFQRVLVTEKISQLISQIKKSGKEIIFETDDLTFDSKYLEQINFLQKANTLEKEAYKNGLSAEIVNDSYVKNCITTTSYLADILREKRKNVFISKNKISNQELKIVEKILKKEKAHDGFIRIGYFSGTFSHNKDFSTVSQVLEEILAKNKKVKLLLAGPLDIEDKLNKFQDRIEFLPRVSREKYYENVNRCDINIIPLEKDNPFCQSKSEIKFIEAGLLGIPTVAVRNQTYSEAIDDGVDGFLADSSDEWVEKITILIEDEEFRKRIGEKAREKVLRDYTNKNSHSEEYYNFLREILNR